MSIFRLGVVLTLVFSTLHARPAVVVTFASVADRVRAQNPDLAAARMRIREAEGRALAAGKLANPELETEFEHNTGFNEGRIEIGVSQKFPITNRLAIERSVSQSEIAAAKAEVEDVARRLSAEAAEALVEVLALREERGLLDEQSRLTRELADTIRDAAERGEGSLLDAGQARVEALQVATEARQLDAREAATLGSLKPLLGMRADEALVVSGSLPPATLPAPGADPDRRADYRAAKLETATADQRVALEHAKSREDIEGGIFAAAERTIDEPNGAENEGIIGLRFRFPLPLWTRNEGGIAEAEAARERKRLETVALGRGIELEAASTRDEMREWKQLVDEIATELLPLAEEQASQTEAAWHNGQSDIQTVLRAREQRLKLAAAKLDALKNFHLARVRHQAAVGNL